jgi:hypothetical protein
MLGAGKGGVDFDYTYAQQGVDSKNSKLNGVKEANPDGTIKRLDMQTGTARLGYGVVDIWDIYGTLGGVQVGVNNFSYADGEDFSSSVGFMYGGGTKLTFWQSGALKIGALGQMNWMDDLSDTVDAGGGREADISFNIVESQIAVGPTYELSQGVSLYGGPFIHQLSGDTEVKWNSGATREREADLEQSSQFGVYIGVEAAIGNSTFASIEYQHTSVADAGGVSLTFRF